MRYLIDLSGKNILVIGASSGIGKQVAITLSQVGARLVLVARRADKLRETCQELEGEGHSYYAADMNETENIEILIKKIIEEQGKLDGMVYAAGVGTSLPLLQFKPEKARKIFDTNFFGFLEAVRQVSRKGKFNEGMRIVGISSIASIVGDKAHTVYSASKAAMDGAVRCMAKELADKGICINTVAPAMVKTDMYAHYLEKYGNDSESNTDLMKRQYLGLAKTEDIANAIAFLLSSAARFITGITLPVDGGTTSC